MHIVVAYDIADDKRRTHVVKILEDFGDRVQESVFECSLDGPAIEELSHRLADKLDPAADTVRIYTQCAACKERIRILGRGTVFEKPKVLIV